ncbi:hypothetical protein GCM10027040_31050 [Halomonas shantousis]
MKPNLQQVSLDLIHPNALNAREISLLEHLGEQGVWHHVSTLPSGRITPQQLSEWLLKDGLSITDQQFIELEALADLANDIQQRGYVLQPVILHPSLTQEGHYTLGGGHRRWLASVLAGLDNIASVVIPFDPTANPQEQALLALETMAVENHRRQNLSFAETVRMIWHYIEAYQTTMGETPSASVLRDKTGTPAKRIYKGMALIKILSGCGLDHKVLHGSPVTQAQLDQVWFPAHEREPLTADQWQKILRSPEGSEEELLGRCKLSKARPNDLRDNTTEQSIDGGTQQDMLESASHQERPVLKEDNIKGPIEYIEPEFDGHLVEAARRLPTVDPDKVRSFVNTLLREEVSPGAAAKGLLQSRAATTNSPCVTLSLDTVRQILITLQEHADIDPKLIEATLGEIEFTEEPDIALMRLIQHL